MNRLIGRERKSERGEGKNGTDGGCMQIAIRQMRSVVYSSGIQVKMYL